MINRKKRNKLCQDILKILSKSARPISTQDLALKLNKPWHSIQTRCLRLQVDKKLKDSVLEESIFGKSLKRGK